MKIVHNKLVRDNIPSIIAKSGRTSRIRVVDLEELVLELKKKLCEEATEVKEAQTTEEIVEEIADVLEVLDAIKNAYSISDSEIETVKELKANKKGRFQNKIYLEYVIEEDK